MLMHVRAKRQISNCCQLLVIRTNAHACPRYRSRRGAPGDVAFDLACVTLASAPLYLSPRYLLSEGLAGNDQVGDQQLDAKPKSPCKPHARLTGTEELRELECGLQTASFRAPAVGLRITQFVLPAVTGYGFKLVARERHVRFPILYNRNEQYARPSLGKYVNACSCRGMVLPGRHHDAIASSHRHRRHMQRATPIPCMRPHWCPRYASRARMGYQRSWSSPDVSACFDRSRQARDALCIGYPT